MAEDKAAKGELVSEIISMALDSLESRAEFGAESVGQLRELATKGALTSVEAVTGLLSAKPQGDIR